MKPQELFGQIINIEDCQEAEPSLFMFEGTTVVELPGIPLGTSVLASFMPESGICELQEALEDAEDAEDFEPPTKVLGVFAMKLTLEPLNFR